MTDEKLINLLVTRSEESARALTEMQVTLGEVKKTLEIVHTDHDRYFDRVRDTETRLVKLELAQPMHSLTHKWVLVGVSVLAGGTLMALVERLLGLVK